MPKTVITLGFTQTLAWASSFYLPAIIADPLASELGVRSTQIFLAFSFALLISALLGPRVGRTIDAVGGRGTLVVSNLVLAGGLSMLAFAPNLATVWAAWSIIGVGMGLGLYDAAFAALGRIYGIAARRPITGITLLAGFASTVGWPLSAWGVAEIGWRHTCLLWAAGHLLIGLPLNASLPNSRATTEPTAEASYKPQIAIDRSMVLLATAFAAAWMVAAAMGAHLPRILMAGGASPVDAVLAAALMGPGQVAARLIEASWMFRMHPLVSARLSAITHPAGAAILLGCGGSIAGYVFTALHGAGNGVLTIARGTVPLALYGPKDYGYRLGILGAPSRVAQAGAPVLFGWLIEHMGVHVLWVTSALSLVALAALMATRAAARPIAG